MSKDSNDKKALIALMDLALALADYATTPPGHRGKAIDRVAAERREVAGWRETLHLLSTEANRQALEASLRQSKLQQVVADGQAARIAVAATERRYDRMWGLEPIEADDSRITDGCKPYGGRPGCGCSVCRWARSVGG